MILETVHLVLHDGDTALGHIRIRVGLVLLGDHGDGSQFRRLDGKAEPRDTGAQDEKICLNFHCCLFS